MSAMSSSPWFSRVLVLALAALPAVANAQSLPKGYASDESPSTPAATAPAAQAEPPAQATMTKTAVDDSTVTATAQISTSTDEYVDTDPSALTDFQEPLQGYGSWVNDATYGTVWVPDTDIVGSDFAPYQTGGYWSLTDDGEWLWVSTYDWGYVPFHYGRWVWISGYGWSWIPGRMYAPAWVTWRVSDYGYIGWAPLPPTYYWSAGVAVYFTTAWPAAYVFCPTSYVFHTHVHTYVVRDKATVKSVAAHSRTYKAATPSAGSVSSSSGGSSAKKPGGDSAKITRPSGPSMKDAGIADAVVPKKRATVDSRAQMFSKKSTTPKAKALVKSQRTASLGSTGNTPASRALSRAGSSIQRNDAGAKARTQGTIASSVTSPGTRSPSAHDARPSMAHHQGLRTPSSTPSRTAPSQVSRPSTPSASRPSTPSVSRPSTPSASRPSTPSVSRPSTPSASRPSTPSVSRPSTPSVSRPSTPSVSRPSTPSVSRPSSPSRGGRR